MNRPSHRSRGSTVIAVIFMFILMSAAITSLTILFATENRRTLATTSGSQLRQLLLASQTFAANDLQAHGPASREVPVPTPVSGATVTLTFTPSDSNKVNVRAMAKLSHASASQTLTYVRADGGTWRLDSAVLFSEP